jgi:hypothetical protein
MLIFETFSINKYSNCFRLGKNGQKESSMNGVSWRKIYQVSNLPDQLCHTLVGHIFLPFSKFKLPGLQPLELQL